MMENPSSERMNNSRLVRVVAGALELQGELSIPQNARGIVLLSQMPIKLEANKKIENIVSSAGLSETTETLKQVADLAGQWFARHLVPIV